MSYEEISAELDQKFTELGQNFGWVRPQTGPELGVKFWIKNPECSVYYKAGANNTQAGVISIDIGIICGDGPIHLFIVEDF